VEARGLAPTVRDGAQLARQPTDANLADLLAHADHQDDVTDRAAAGPHTMIGAY
jgi:hypothetical protein